MGFFRKDQQPLDKASLERKRQSNWQAITETTKSAGSILQHLMDSDKKPPVLNRATLELPSARDLELKTVSYTPDHTTIRVA